MKNSSPYLKMRVLGAIDMAEGRSRQQRIRRVAEMTFVDEDGQPRSFTWRTIQTWYSRYKKHGITGVTSQSRRDKGQPRKVTPEELLEAINAAKPHFHEKRRTRMALYRFCIEKGLLQKSRIAQTTFFRFVREYDLLKPEAEDNKRRLAFSMQYANQLWQADTLHGPHVSDGKSSRQTYLIAFIDDASRVLCHGEFFFEENVDALAKALRAAFYKRGVPEQLYVDNGSIYASQEITLICSRVGCILRHTAVRDAAAKGKIERFFRRVRDQFLNRRLDLSSLAALNQQFTAWVEDEYNGTEHSGIGMKPIDRFGLDLRRIRFLPPSDANDELFYAEAERKVKKDNTFSFRNIRYETPVDLRGKEIQIRYERHHAGPVVIFYKGQRMGAAKPLDAIANGLLRRKESNS
jgi:putative transposase